MGRYPVKEPLPFDEEEDTSDHNIGDDTLSVDGKEGTFGDNDDDGSDGID